MTTSYQTNLISKSYNGYANYETWNVALWIQNDYGFYSIARRCDDYAEFVADLCGGCVQTPDGVLWNDSKLDTDELDEVIAEL